MGKRPPHYAAAAGPNSGFGVGNVLPSDQHAVAEGVLATQAYGAVRRARSVLH